LSLPCRLTIAAGLCTAMATLIYIVKMWDTIDESGNGALSYSVFVEIVAGVVGFSVAGITCTVKKGGEGIRPDKYGQYYRH
jgi:hypothetical protein